jgi:hypothetical protein
VTGDGQNPLVHQPLLSDALGPDDSGVLPRPVSYSGGSLRRWVNLVIVVRIGSGWHFWMTTVGCFVEKCSGLQELRTEGSSSCFHWMGEIPKT